MLDDVRTSVGRPKWLITAENFGQRTGAEFDAPIVLCGLGLEPLQ
jgi:hypothetical protein